MNEDPKPGTLYLVSTPIGNLGDITFRAVKTLRQADLVAAEDTRHTGTLLKQFDISNTVVSYHDHNKEQKGPGLVKKLLAGDDIALVSDAGTPGISDPAFYLVRMAVEQGIPVSSVPGPSAAISALIVSGLPTDRFVFEGFLPVKKRRNRRLAALAQETRTIILYESPYRLLKTLQQIREIAGNRNIAVCRELTKKFEEVVRGTIDDAITYFSSVRIRGEFVLIIEGRSLKNDKTV